MATHQVTRTHCPKGHPYDKANTLTVTKGEGRTARQCRTCHRARTKRTYRNKPPDQRAADARRDQLKRLYGMSVETYDAMLASQGMRCAICRKVPVREGRRLNLDVDHDHETGLIRGLLCHNCNKGIGNLQESVTVLRAAIRYLQRAAGIDRDSVQASLFTPSRPDFVPRTKTKPG